MIDDDDGVDVFDITYIVGTIRVESSKPIRLRIMFPPKFYASVLSHLATNRKCKNDFMRTDEDDDNSNHHSGRAAHALRRLFIAAMAHCFYNKHAQ